MGDSVHGKYQANQPGNYRKSHAHEEDNPCSIFRHPVAHPQAIKALDNRPKKKPAMCKTRVASSLVKLSMTGLQEGGKLTIVGG